MELLTGACLLKSGPCRSRRSGGSAASAPFREDDFAAAGRCGVDLVVQLGVRLSGFCTKPMPPLIRPLISAASRLEVMTMMRLEKSTLRLSLSSPVNASALSL